MPLYFDKLDDYLLPDSDTITTFLMEEHEEDELENMSKEQVDHILEHEIFNESPEEAALWMEHESHHFQAA